MFFSRRVRWPGASGLVRGGGSFGVSGFGMVCVGVIELEPGLRQLIGFVFATTQVALTGEKRHSKIVAKNAAYKYALKDHRRLQKDPAFLKSLPPALGTRLCESGV